MANPATDISITSLRGGQNDTDPQNALPDDQVVLAENVEFFSSMLGERRNGCGPLAITSSDLEDESVIVHLSQWYPLNDVLNPEFIAISATPLTSVTMAARTLGTWAEVVPSPDAIDFSNTDIYSITTQALNGKLFTAYHSAVDRLHIRDAVSGTFRRAGLAQPAPPTAANEGVGVTYTAVRYFRVRYITKSGSVIVNRSEPSTSLKFTPSGAGAGATITKPASINEGETHWEFEASSDNATFYLVATTVVGTTTYNDVVQDSTPGVVSYNASGPVSDAIGSYVLLPSAKFLAVDGDRLLYAGHWTDTTRQSQIGWTPVFNDPGVGNDERAPIVTTGGTPISTTASLDNFDGGPITGIAASVYGTWYAFKWDHVYMMIRTGDVTRSYDVITLSSRHGAIPGSIVKGVDENGAAAIYFLDPLLGPHRVGSNGIQIITGLRNTWSRVNTQAANVVARGCHYPYKQQLHWWLAVDGADSPTLKIILQISEVQQYTDPVAGPGAARGWSTATGRIAQAYAVSVFTEVVTINAVNSLSERPFIGLTSPDYIQRCDTEAADAGVAYVATILTRPYFLTSLLNHWGVMNGSLLAVANASASMTVSLIRDFGVETSAALTTSLAPVGAETFVVKDFDNLSMSGATIIQIKFSG